MALSEQQKNRLFGSNSTNEGGSVSPVNYKLPDDADPTITSVDTSQIGPRPLVSTGPSAALQSKNSNSDTSTFQPIPNFLHDYTTYTYNLSLSALTTDNYNDLMRGKYSPNNVLIASAGRHNDTDFKRHPFWKNDFYFGDFNLDSVIGTPASGKGTNVITLDFTIVEPYGITLIDLLVLTAKDLGINNYLKVPYLLQIDFFGYDQNNLNPRQIPNTQRRIPIYMTGIDIDFNENGTVYRISAVPYNYWAFMDTASTVPFVAKLRGEKTKKGGILLKSLLSTDDTLAQNIVNDAQQRLNIDHNLPSKGNTSSVNTDQQDKSPTLGAAGLGTLLNAYYEFMGELDYDGGAAPFKYTFTLKDLDSSTGLANAELYSDALKALTTSVSSQSSDNDRAASAKEQVGHGATVVPSKAGVDVTFPAGISILEIISQLLKSTDYFQKQIQKGTKISENSNPLDFFKVSPNITMGDWIEQRKDWQRKIEFVITPYKKYGGKQSFAPTGKPKLSDCVKRYDYLYTGKNTDIVDLKIQFNTAYYTQYTLNPTRFPEDTSQAVEQKDASSKNKQTDITPKDNSYKFPAANYAVPHSSSNTLQTTRDEIMVRVGDVFTNVYQNSQADMLSIDMTILGDPSYIMEEDFLYSTGSALLSSRDPRLTKAGSLFVNKGDLLIHMDFKLPEDIDTESGLFQFNAPIRLGSPVFTGIYQVITVRSIFSNGVFRQQLSIVRMINDPYSDPESTDSNVGDRNQGYT